MTRKKKTAAKPSEEDVFSAICEELKERGGGMHDPSRGAWYLWGDRGWERGDNAILKETWKRETGATWNAVRGAIRRAQATFATREADVPDPLDPPGLVGFPDGTVWDGVTIRPVKPNDWVTKRTAAAPAESSERWGAFVEQWCSGDEAAAAALQGTMGISLLGRTHRRFLVFEGERRSGKTTFLAAVARAFGDYAGPISSRLFIARDDHETLLASIAGLRFAWADEAPGNRAIASERLKAISGGEMLSARYMRQDHFSFTPQALLCLAANDIPFLRTPDDALLDRMRRVQFRESFPPDPGFAVTFREGHLNAEIVRWAMDGYEACGGMAPECDAWTAATAEYAESQDLPRAVGEVFEKVERDSPHLSRGRVVEVVRGWYAAHSSGRAPHPREIHAEVRRQFEHVSEGKVAGGVRGYWGIGVVDAADSRPARYPGYSPGGE